jgi:hypothetical protein
MVTPWMMAQATTSFSRKESNVRTGLELVVWTLAFFIDEIRVSTSNYHQS